MRSKFELASCQECGRLFTRFSGRNCPTCREIERLQMENVIGYIRGRPGADVEEISAALNLPRATVMRFADEGVFRRYSLAACYPCRICQCDIEKGVICLKCNEALNNQISSLKEAIWAEPPMNPVPDAELMEPRKTGDWGDADSLYGDSSSKRKKERAKKNRGTGWCR